MGAGGTFGLTPAQFTILAGTLLIANIAVFWYLRRTYFKKGEAGVEGVRKPQVDPEEWREFELVEKRQITHNSSIYRFRLPDPNTGLNLPIGQHLQLRAEWNGKEVVRSYTPITLDDSLGYFELLIKAYPQGNASRYMDSLKVGDRAPFRGPKGRFLYRQNMAKAVGMIAGGTGLTPILQVIKAILRDPQDTTKVSLISANVTEDDILLHHELLELAKKHSNQLRVHFVLNEAPEGWTGGVGFVTADVIKKMCPPPDPSTKILMCGPPAMMVAMTKILTEELGYPAQSQPPSPEDAIQRF